MSTTVVDELVTVLGFRISPSAVNTLNKFNDGVKGVSKFANVVTASLVGASAALFWFVERNNNAAASMYRFQQVTGISTTELQKWSYAANQAGGSTDAIKADLMALEEHLHNFDPTAYNEALGRLVGPQYQQRFKNNFKGMTDALADELQKLSPEKAMGALRGIGLSSENNLLWRSGSAGIAKGMAGAPILSPGATKQAEAFRKEWDRIKTQLANTSMVIASKFTPVLIKLMERFDRWISSSKTQKTALGLLNVAVALLGKTFETLEKYVTSISEAFEGSTSAIEGFAKWLSKDSISNKVIVAVIGGITFALLAANKELAIFTAYFALLEMLWTMKPGDQGFFGIFGWMAEKLDRITSKLAILGQFFDDMKNKSLEFAFKNMGEETAKLEKGQPVPLGARTINKALSNIGNIFQDPVKTLKDIKKGLEGETPGPQTSIKNEFNLTATNQQENVAALNTLLHTNPYMFSG